LFGGSIDDHKSLSLLDQATSYIEKVKKIKKKSLNARAMLVATTQSNSIPQKKNYEH